MSDGTHIEWTDASWNPLRARRAPGTGHGGYGPGWVCQRVSPGCQRCYAETINKRLGTGLSYDAEGLAESTPYLDEAALMKPLHWRKPRKVFVCSMTDLFGEWVPDEWLDRVFAVMALSPRHTFQVLTKRPERMRAYLSAPDIEDRVYIAGDEIDPEDRCPVRQITFPLNNVWMMTSVENQTEADKRIPELLATPAAVRGLSCEPLLGRVDLRLDGEELCGPGPGIDPRRTRTGPNGLHWVIVGGESGPGARPMDLAWARSLVAQCQAAGVAVFVKQLGSNPVTACVVHGVSCGGHKWPWNENEAQARGKEPRPKLKDRKGGDMTEWPEDLRVRQFPSV